MRYVRRRFGVFYAAATIAVGCEVGGDGTSFTAGGDDGGPGASAGDDNPSDGGPGTSAGDDGPSGDGPSGDGPSGDGPGDSTSGPGGSDGPNGSESSADTGEDPPVGDGYLAFSDLVYAPADANQNAFVTIWGLDLPNDPTVEVGGKVQTVLRKAQATGMDGTVWLPEHPGLVRDGLTPTYEGELYDVIEVELTDVAAGDTALTVQGVGGSLPFTVGSTGNVYFIAPGGNNSGAGTIGAPWADWGGAEQNGGPGDVIYLREGTYGPTTMLGDSVAFGNSIQGQPGAPVAAVAYPGETVTLTGAAAFRQGAGNGTIAKFIRTGGSLRMNGGGGNLRFVGNDVSGENNPGGANYISIGATTDTKVLGNYFHDAGNATSNQSEGVYVAGFGAQDTVYVEHNHFTDSRVKAHVLVYGHTDNDSLSNLYIRHNYAHQPGGTMYGQGALISGSDGSVKAWVTDATVVGNTFTEMPQACMTVVQPSPMAGQSMMTAVIDNNVCHSNSNDIIVTNTGPGSTASGNSTEQGITGADVGIDISVSNPLTWPDL